jgi:hypothetical protein
MKDVGTAPRVFVRLRCADLRLDFRQLALGSKRCAEAILKGVCGLIDAYIRRCLGEFGAIVRNRREGRLPSGNANVLENGAQLESRIEGAVS